MVRYEPKEEYQYVVDKWVKADEENRRLREKNERLERVVEATANLLNRRECENFHELVSVFKCCPPAENICGLCALDAALDAFLDGEDQ